jgi:hypothetical protein
MIAQGMRLREGVCSWSGDHVKAMDAIEGTRSEQFGYYGIKNLFGRGRSCCERSLQHPALVRKI